MPRSIGSLGRTNTAPHCLGRGTFPNQLCDGFSLLSFQGSKFFQQASRFEPHESRDARWLIPSPPLKSPRRSAHNSRRRSSARSHIDRSMPGSLMPGLVQVSNWVFGDANGELPLFRDPPGIVQTRHELNRAEEPRQILRGDAHGNDDFTRTI